MPVLTIPPSDHLQPLCTLPGCGLAAVGAERQERGRAVDAERNPCRLLGLLLLPGPSAAGRVTPLG